MSKSTQRSWEPPAKIWPGHCGNGQEKRSWQIVEQSILPSLQGHEHSFLSILAAVTSRRFPNESEATSTQTHNPQLVSNLKSNLLRNSFIFKTPHFWLIPNAMGYLMQWASLSFLISQSAWLIEAIVSFVCHCIVPLSSDNKKPYWWNCRVSLK